MELDALNKYLEATRDHIGVEAMRYAGGYWAIVAPRVTTDFLFEKLEGGDFDALGAMEFLWENPLFPAAFGATPQEALTRLSNKLGILYEFEPADGLVHQWDAKRRFELKAQYDADAPGESRGWYDVSWYGIVQDLDSDSLYYYEVAKDECGDSVHRNLHALISFEYKGEFAALFDRA